MVLPAVEVVFDGTVTVVLLDVPVGIPVDALAEPVGWAVVALGVVATGVVGLAVVVFDAEVVPFSSISCPRI